MNDVRIQEQMYITLKLEDKLRFGYDILSLFLVLVKTHNPVTCRAAGVRSFDSVPSGPNADTHTFLNPSVSHTNLFTVVRGELTVPEEALKVRTRTHTHKYTHTHLARCKLSSINIFGGVTLNKP